MSEPMISVGSLCIFVKNADGCPSSLPMMIGKSSLNPLIAKSSYLGSTPSGPYLSFVNLPCICGTSLSATESTERPSIASIPFSVSGEPANLLLNKPSENPACGSLAGMIPLPIDIT